MLWDRVKGKEKNPFVVDFSPVNPLYLFRSFRPGNGGVVESNDEIE